MLELQFIANNNQKAKNTIWYMICLSPSEPVNFWLCATLLYKMEALGPNFVPLYADAST